MTEDEFRRLRSGDTLTVLEPFVLFKKDNSRPGFDVDKVIPLSKGDILEVIRGPSGQFLYAKGDYIWPVHWSSPSWIRKPSPLELLAITTLP